MPDPCVKSTWSLILAACLLLAGSGSAVPAQGPEITNVIEEAGIDPIRIAVPTAATSTGAVTFARELVETVRDDLAFSGYFSLHYTEEEALQNAAAGGDPDFAAWLATGAEALLLIQVRLAEERYSIDVRMFDPAGRSRILHQRYGGSADLVRRLAHQIADEILGSYDGLTGIASTTIAFISRHGDAKELYMMDYDGRRIRRMTDTGVINTTPSWAPVGDRLALVSWRNKRQLFYIIEPDGTFRTVPILAGELNTSPDWSNDGSKMLYVTTHDHPGNAEIYALDLGSGKNRRLTYSPAIDTEPDFSPTGRQIAFTSDRSGGPQIYTMDPEGANVRRVSKSGSYNSSPAWSPSGDRLAWVSRIEGRHQIVVLDLNSGTLSRLTRGNWNHENPAWSPDGRHLVFASNREGVYHIYTMRADGGNIRQLTTGVSGETPDWSR